MILTRRQALATPLALAACTPAHDRRRTRPADQPVSCRPGRQPHRRHRLWHPLACRYPPAVLPHRSAGGGRPRRPALRLARLESRTSCHQAPGRAGPDASAILLPLNAFEQLPTVPGLLSTVPAGYAFAQLRFCGRDRPFQALVGALVPWLTGIFGIFLIRQYALAVPDEMLEAARIDGASERQIFVKIVLPALRPVLVTLALFLFLGSWNAFIWPLIILTDQSLYPRPVALAALSREHVQDNERMMAGSVVTTVPVLLLFLALQRYYLRGLLADRVKG